MRIRLMFIRMVVFICVLIFVVIVCFGRMI